MKQIPKHQILIVTCAGKATRFMNSLIERGLPPIHKCIAEVTPGNYLTSPLGRLLHFSLPVFEHIIVVTGYKSETIEEYINQHFPGNDVIKSVYNKDWNVGSVRSIQCGLEASKKYLDFEKQLVTFVEGDLLFDGETFCEIVESDKEIITHVNRGIIDMSKAVLCTISDLQPFWRYSTNHNSISIQFANVSKIFESGQVWKFKMDKNDANWYLKNCYLSKDGETNLVPLNSRTWEGDFQILTWKKWANVNTIEDLEKFYEK